MKLYDSLTKQIVEFDTTQVSIYNCGPTVYNHIHIGNARPLVVFDVLYRYLKFINSDVKYVLNITDIDDKIINKALADNKPEKVVSEFYYEAYLDIKKQLNTLEMFNPKVSDNINEIIAYIEQLMLKGYAYKIGSDVYFDTSKIKEYGELSKNNVAELASGARIEVDPHKKNPNDFVLWKKTDKGIKWNSPWGEGRPGWHTECSCLINKYLGDQVCIHGGGMDLKFPHHENENAQNRALKNKTLAKIWLHIGMINIDNQKMSKSLNNFILVKDIFEEYSYKALRWFFYQTNFANPLNYSDKIMQEMEESVSKIEKAINVAKTKLILQNYDLNFDPQLIEKTFIEYLDNNLNITNCVSQVYKIIKDLNQNLNQKEFSNAMKNLNIVINMLQILGIEFENKHTLETISKIKYYQQLLNERNFAESDKIRAELIQLGVL